jgi:lysophospholipase L1-like esterase
MRMMLAAVCFLAAGSPFYLDWTHDRMVLLGDSIVIGAPLPVRMCDLEIENAAVSGISARDVLRKGDGPSAARFRLAVLAVGVNDTMKTRWRGRYAFRREYRAALDRAQGLTHTLVLAAPAPVALTEGYGRDRFAYALRAVRQEVKQAARERGHRFVDLSSVAPDHTTDGVHLSAVGYERWMRAITDGVRASVWWCPPP